MIDIRNIKFPNGVFTTDKNVKSEKFLNLLKRGLKVLNVSYNDLGCPTECAESFAADEPAVAIPDPTVSTSTTSKYLLKEPTADTFSIDGPKIRDINSKSFFSMFKMPTGNLTNSIVPVTKVGAMSTATITQVGSYDKVVVTGTDQTSNFYFPFIATINKAVYRLKIQVNALGSTAPLIGLINIWPGNTYSNFNFAQFYTYINLLTGVISQQTGDTLLGTYNGWSGAAAVGDIIELEIVHEYTKPRYVKYRKGNITTQFSIYSSQKPLTQAGAWPQITQPGVILTDGTYTILDYEIFSLDSDPFIVVEGDSMGSGFGIPYEGTLRGQLEAKLPYRIGNISAGTKLLAGHLSTLWELSKMRPKYMVLFHYLEATQGNANPANGNYATWSANFAKYISSVKAMGITPIIIYPQTWAVLDPSGTNSAYYETYLNTNYASELKIKVPTSESSYDSSGFHYSSATYGWIADQIVSLLDGLGTL